MRDRTWQLLGRDFFLFAMVGLIATIVQYATLIFLVSSTHCTPTAASSTGFLLGALVNYWLNRRYTFQSDKAHYKAGMQFALVASIGFCLNGSLMMLGTHFLELPYLWVQVFATLLVLFWNFFANRYWTFRQGS